jgi:hypothetical protein
MNCCRRFPLALHVAQNFALAVAQRSQLLALQKFDVAVQNRQRRLQVVRCGARALVVR